MISLIALAALMQDADPLAPLANPAPAPPQQQVYQAPLPEVTPLNILLAIEAGRWAEARALVDRMDPRDPVEATLRAELYLAPGSPEASAAELVALLDRGRDLPQAGRLARLAQTRGAPPQPVVSEQPIISMGTGPRRVRAREVADATTAAVRADLRPSIEENTPERAEGIFQSQRASLPREGLAEMAQRVAFIYYVVGRDSDARRRASSASRESMRCSTERAS